MTQACPICKEEIIAGALKCKHCHSMLPVTTLSHEGTCPLCKETIKTDAIRCKHCHANLDPNSPKNCCHCMETDNRSRHQLMFKNDDFLDNANNMMCRGGVMWCRNGYYGRWYECGSCEYTISPPDRFKK